MAAFTGFDDRFFRFFEDLKKHNDRTWFNANKTRYADEVVGPMVAFIEDMAPRLSRLSRHLIADPKPHGGSMFRIYRDVRFSKDKRPYKEHAACHFRHVAGRTAHAPGYYLHLAPEEIVIGGGIWQPPKDPLMAIRTRIAERTGDWTRVVNDKRLQETFGTVSGEALTRPPATFDADHKHIADIKRKTFFARTVFDRRAAVGAEFIDVAAEHFAAAVPLMRFLCRALDLKF